MMKMDVLLPLNGQVIPTKRLTELGFNTKNISKLVKEEKLIRTRRGYYKVNIKIDIDHKLMVYYLSNNLFDEFKEYYDRLEVKDYEAYYYYFMYDIMITNYDEAYKTLIKCCELNNKKENKINLYIFVLLLNELMNLSNKKLLALKNKLFNDPEDALSLFLECIIKGDYEAACNSLREHKDHLSKLEVRVLRDLSLKAKEVNHQKTSPEMERYNQLFKTFFECIINNDYESGYYYFSKMYNLSEQVGIKDNRLNIIGDLFGCFNYIVEHQDITLDTYKTSYKYNDDNIANFNQAIKQNDYINALRYVVEILKEHKDPEYIIYYNLLERIYNFLNIRSVIKSRMPEPLSLNTLVKDKKYKEALALAGHTNMDVHDRNIVTSLLESLVDLDDKNYKSEN